MNHQDQQKISRKVNQLLRECNVQKAPVDVEAIARSRGIDVRRTPADDDLSGFLLKKPDGIAVIGVNASHHPNRQRFTIGHEIGHFMLHQYDEVHVDKIVVKLRDRDSSTGEDRQEIEANRFSAELLMPFGFLEQDLPRFAADGMLTDRGMSQLAKHYQVSVQAMKTRLVSLGLIYDGEGLGNEPD